MEPGRQKRVKGCAVQRTRNESAAYYDAAWKQWDHMIRLSPGPRIRRDKVMDWLSKVAPQSLLDVGCGNGELLFEIRRLMPGTRLTGADISPAVIGANRVRFPDMSFYELDLNREMLPMRFDAVVCMEVLEHCKDLNGEMERLAAMTGKWLFITVPCGPVFEIDRRVGHMRHFRAKEIEAALTHVGFQVLELKEWGFPFFNLYKHLINLMPDKSCENFLSEKRYGFKEKMLAAATYAAFNLCLAKWGYQLFVMAARV
jgi:SAM-dependent methyltransferase